MKRIYPILILLTIAIIVVVVACSSNKQKRLVPKDTSITFAQRMDNIYASVGNTGVFQQRLSSKDFLTVYENPRPYQSDAISFLAGNDTSSENQYTAILSMGRLDVEDYVGFVDTCYALFQINKITEHQLEIACCYSMINYVTLAENYDNKNVIRLLTKIKNDKRISTGFKECIESDLNGNNRRHSFWDYIKTKILD